MLDTLLDAGVTVVVISPNQIKNLRGRYGSAGNKDDAVAVGRSSVRQDLIGLVCRNEMHVVEDGL